MSDAVTVPPGLLIRTTTALILSSFEALVSSSLNVANMLGCGTRPSLSCELMTPDRSSNSTFPSPVPLSCTSCTGPGGSMRLTVMQPACRPITAMRQSQPSMACPLTGCGNTVSARQNFDGPHVWDDRRTPGRRLKKADQQGRSE